MNTTKLLSSALIAVASMTAASAFAGDWDSYPADPAPTSQLSRAQVRAQLAQAERDGSAVVSEKGYPGTLASASTKTRAQVQAELRDAQRAGYTNRIDNAYPGDVAQNSSNVNVRG